MQFFRIDTQNPETHPSLDFFAYSKADSNTVSLIKSACYDCHSYETKYPSYVQFAPISWWMNNHIKGGRKQVNFSLWHDYSSEEKGHKIQECIEEIEDDHMPIKSYKWMHSDANWDETQKDQVVKFLKAIKDSAF